MDSQTMVFITVCIIVFFVAIFVNDQKQIEEPNDEDKINDEDKGLDKLKIEREIYLKKVKEIGDELHSKYKDEVDELECCLPIGGNISYCGVDMKIINYHKPPVEVYLYERPDYSLDPKDHYWMYYNIYAQAINCEYFDKIKGGFHSKNFSGEILERLKQEEW